MTAEAPVVLTVAGSDPSGGAGLQADLKTIQAHGGYGAAVPTLLTVQSTRGVERAELLPAELVGDQLDRILSDLQPKAAKTGALGRPEVARAVGAAMRHTGFPWVVDPVWLPSEGAPLSRGDIVGAYGEALLPHATLVTPNATEAALFTGREVRTVADARRAAERIAAMGARAVLVKGGHLEGADRGTDVLFHEGVFSEHPPASRLDGAFHGTGCALSAAIATRLAWGHDVPLAVRGAKAWLTVALQRAFPVGRGALPVNHLCEVTDKP